MRERLNKMTAVATMLVLASVCAFAAPTALTVFVVPQNNYAVQAGQLNLAFTACDASNGNSFVATGREILIVNNTGASAYTFTVTSTADSYGRLDTSLTAYSVAAGAITGLSMTQLQGWAGSGNVVTLACSNAAVKYAVLRY